MPRFWAYPSGIFDDVSCTVHNSKDCIAVDGLGQFVCIGVDVK